MTRDDPVTNAFKTKYEERMESLNTQLLPAMERCQCYLHELSIRLKEYMS